MIVISDTSVITYLIQLDLILILKEIFDDVIIPNAVREELEKIANQKELLKSYDWIKTVSIKDVAFYNTLKEKLDKGEAEAIVLSLELKADLLLIDEKKGRKIATEYGIMITGLLGILIDAKKYGSIESVKTIICNLFDNIGFLISPNLYKHILSLVNED
ncbi:MAG: DUF3368 domain-containing protein [Bacteroidota bacterium]